MKPKLIFSLIVLAFWVSSCRKEIKSEQGGIDLISNVYFNASKGLNQMESFHFSKINYFQNQLVELVPDAAFPEINKRVYFIEDSLCYQLDTLENNIIFSALAKKQKQLLVWNKKEGAVFSKDWIFNYIHRKDLEDTVLFNKKYKRFEINSPWNYSRFYVYPTDTILPYSLYKHAEKDYHGRIERIDSYNKKDDIFVTLQLVPRKNWDEEAKDLFEFNHFVHNQKGN